MKLRSGVLFATTLMVLAGGCASGGGGGGGGGSAEPTAEGYEPQDTDATAQAQLFLSQAESAEDEATRDERYRQALELLVPEIQTDSLNPLPPRLAAYILLMLDEDYERISDYLDMAEELYPPYAEELMPEREQAWINLYNQALGPANAGEYEEAIRLFELANDLYDRRPEAFVQIGLISEQMGETEQAIAALEDAVDAAQIQLQDMRDLASSEEPPANAAELVSSAEDALFSAVRNFAAILSQNGQYAEAAAAYQDYLEEYPDNTQALANYAGLLSQAQMPDSAQAIFEGLLNRGDLSSGEYLSVGIGLYQAEDWTQAAEAFSVALDANPNSSEAAVNRALALAEAEAWSELAEAAQTAIDLRPYSGFLYQLQARALSETGDVAGANEAINAYQELPFSLDGLQLQTQAGASFVTGILTNQSLSEGESISITFHVTDETGTEVGSTTYQVMAPAEGTNTQVDAQIPTENEIGDSFWYEVP